MEQEQGSRPDVRTAFEMLLGEIDAEMGQIQQQGASALESGDTNAAGRSLQLLKRLKAVRKRVVAARNAWRSAHSRPRRRSGTRQVSDPSGSADQRPVPREAFVMPILRALDRLGGSGRVAQVLDLVAEEVGGRLKPVDLAPVPSDPSEPRWRNRARWCRKDMVVGGLLRKDSPRGVWELSEEGSRMLEAEGREN